MGTHPINLAFRFLLELTALIAAGYWGWNQSESWIKYVLALGIPLILAAIWGIFAVPDDPSRSGSAPVATPGILRLLLEVAFFAFAVWVLHDSGFYKLSWVFGILITIHYLLSFDRIKWLMEH